MTDDVPDVIDVRTPNVARIYDYVLGGKDNFAADREAAEQILAAFPEAREGVRQNRAFLVNAVRYLAEHAGIRQFLDIGTGLPTQQNVHEVAQAVAPDARIVYVDNDPVVCAHGQALLAGANAVAMIRADLRRPEQILDAPTTRGLIDFTRPVAVLLVSLLHFIQDEDDPFSAVARLREVLVPGSHLVISHMLEGERRQQNTSQVKTVYSRASSGLAPRTREQIRSFFGNFELLDPSLFVSPELLERFANLGWGGVARRS